MLVAAAASLFYVFRILGEVLVARRTGVGIELVSFGWGPTLFKMKFGSTTVRLALIPFQSYVRFAGELGDASAPDSLWRRRWVPLAVFAAPVAATLVVTMAIGALIHGIGPIRASPWVGFVDSAEEKAGMHPGDRIVSAAGTRIECIEDYRIAMTGFSPGTPVPVQVERQGIVLDLNVTAGGFSNHFVGPSICMIYTKEGPMTDLAPGDEIIEAEWKGHRRTILQGRRDFAAVLETSAGQPLTLTVRRHDRRRQVTVNLPTRTARRYPRDDALLEPIVGSVAGGSPADAMGLAPGDRILRLDNTDVRSWADLRDRIRSCAGSSIRLGIDRAGRRLDFDLRVPEHGRIGITLQPTPVLAHVAAGGYWHSQGLREGDRLVRVHRTEGELRVEHLFSQEGPPVLELVVNRNGRLLDLKVSPETSVVADDSSLGIELGPSWVRLSRPLGESLARGAAEPFRLLGLSLRLLRKSFVGDDSPRNMSGPVGIASMSKPTMPRNPSNYFELLALIYANMIVILLLPIPVRFSDGARLWILVPSLLLQSAPPSPRFLTTVRRIENWLLGLYCAWFLVSVGADLMRIL